MTILKNMVVEYIISQRKTMINFESNQFVCHTV